MIIIGKHDLQAGLLLAPFSACPEFSAKCLHLRPDLLGLPPAGPPRLKLPDHRRVKLETLILLPSVSRQNTNDWSFRSISSTA